MPQRTKAHRKSAKRQASNTHHYCRYCKANRDGRGFDKHQAACKIIWQLQCRQQDPIKPRSFKNRSEEQMRAEKVVNSSVTTEVDFLVDVHCYVLMKMT